MGYLYLFAQINIQHHGSGARKCGNRPWRLVSLTHDWRRGYLQHLGLVADRWWCGGGGGVRGRDGQSGLLHDRAHGRRLAVPALSSKLARVLRGRQRIHPVELPARSSVNMHGHRGYTLRHEQQWHN